MIFDEKVHYEELTHQQKGGKMMRNVVNEISRSVMCDCKVTLFHNVDLELLITPRILHDSTFL